MSPRKTSLKSWVWNHFVHVRSCDIEAKCTYCDSRIGYKGGSTSSMIKHLRTVHNIGGPRPRAGVKRTNSACSFPSSAPAPTSSFAQGRDRDQIIARLAAEDNIPFSTIAKSPTLRLLIEHYVGHTIPRSPNTIKAIVMRKAEEFRQRLGNELKKYQRDGGSFSVAFDEATAANSPNRYVSLTLRAEARNETIYEAGEDFYLGLVTIRGRATADAIADAVRERLEKFHVNLQNCFFAITDGASVMKSSAAKLNLRSQLCLVHGLHIALSKVLLKASELSTSQLRITADCVTEEEASESDTDSTSDDGAESANIHDASSDDSMTSAGSESFTSDSEHVDVLEFVSVRSALDDLRRILKKIKRSGPKRDRLRELTKTPAYNGKRLQIIIDTKIRWYSTISMLQRAVEIMPAINAVLEEFEEKSFSRQERKELENILEVLLPFKEAMKCLCTSKATLIHADRIVLTLLNNLRVNTSPLSVALQAALIVEARKRRTILSSLLNYLLDSTYDSAIEYVLGSGPARNSELQELVVQIVSRELVDESFCDQRDEEGMITVSSSPPKLDFSEIFKTPIASQRASSQPVAAGERIAREMRLHEAGQGLGKFLKICLWRLLTIQPTSVKPERDFSSMNYVCSKTRNSLSPNTLDSLVLLRSAYNGNGF